MVAAVIESEGRILIGQRRSDDRHPFKWEFPGGKVEARESPREALKRELEEELNIDAEIGPEIARYLVQYPKRSPIALIFHTVTSFTGEMRNQCFEQIQWVTRDQLTSYDFLEGDFDFVRRLANEEL